ncbi:hypothetical protein FRC09_008049 [Ceratobasidium sp. 395]|nr:hypothetical protein FRC09_008049 [Ceratobasidium sp. 395]
MVLMTIPMSLSALQTLGRVEILAKRVKGGYWVERGHWSNFVIKINRQAGSKSSPEEDHDSPNIKWSCFEGSSKKRSDQRQMIMDRSHEIWSYVQPGDRLEVGLKGRSWYYLPEDSYEVSVRVWDLWKPSPEMLALA